eukprot:Gb_25963 [translate_table: standard]
MGEFILHLNVDYIDFGSDFYGVGKGHLEDRQHAHQRILHPIPQPPITKFPFMEHPKEHSIVEEMGSIVGTLMEIDHAFQDMSLMIRECGYHTYYVDSTYDINHGQGSTFLESSVATVYERVVGVGPSREFQEPWVELTFDLTQRWPSYIGPENKHFEQPSVDLPSCTTTLKVMTCVDTTPMVSQTHDSSTSPLDLEVTTCPNTALMASVPKSMLGSQTYDPMASPLGYQPAGIDDHHVIGRRSQKTNEDL